MCVCYSWKKYTDNLRWKSLETLIRNYLYLVFHWCCVSDVFLGHKVLTSPDHAIKVIRPRITLAGDFINLPSIAVLMGGFTYQLVYNDTKHYVIKCTSKTHIHQVISNYVYYYLQKLIHLLMFTFQCPKQGLPETQWSPQSLCTTPQSAQRRPWRRLAGWIRFPGACRVLLTSLPLSRIYKDCMLWNETEWFLQN